ncbi:hypothetical protein SISNIDRAFT_543608 [Sistotremastrum niveocremeum HHB9708]|uniref:DUF2470 domain-containing protein n=2 Tax=Sistotremastraceae TaxID=3402574 RepID=A0A164WQQ4_9AGAM|nr:hypothetical protein SISNIDRAFT_543608 [Sistotremastrum niveocremeum HHB9708]KZT35901.1 hypothetical protein SISSUDRAFT_121003 [Sistotremastrum suecicum HHB10207 ss-3]
MASDSVAERSGFLCTYMSNHPDTLVAYVRHQGGVSEHVTSAQMTAIDQKAMTLVYKVKGKDEKITKRVAFDPPLSGYDEVKPRLLGMKLDAEESLGMIPRPQLKPFQFPLRALYLAPLLILLIYTTYAPESRSHLGYWLRRMVGGPKVVWGIWIFVYVVHVLEALYTVSLCRKYRTGWVDGLLYTGGTLLFGFAIWSDMRQRVQKMRIDSIGKIH